MSRLVLAVAWGLGWLAGWWREGYVRGRAVGGLKANWAIQKRWGGGSRGG